MPAWAAQRRTPGRRVPQSIHGGSPGNSRDIGAFIAEIPPSLSTPYLQKRLLRRIFRILRLAQYRPGHAAGKPPLALDQTCELRLVFRSHPCGSFKFPAPSHAMTEFPRRPFTFFSRAGVLVGLSGPVSPSCKALASAGEKG